MSRQTASISARAALCAVLCAQLSLLSFISGACAATPSSHKADHDPRAHAQDLDEAAFEAMRARAEAARLNTDPAMTTRAARAAEAADSETLKMLQGEYSEEILRALGVEDEAGIEDRSHAPPGSVPELSMLVFVSSSLPLQTLRNYAAALERTGGAMVLRGGVGGLKTLGPTVDLIMKILKVDPRCEGADCDMRDVSVLIDPILFQKARVTQVPAVAVVGADPFAAWCEKKEGGAAFESLKLTYGDASIEAHLDELARQGDARAKVLRAALEKKGRG